MGSSDLWAGLQAKNRASMELEQLRQLAAVDEAGAIAGAATAAHVTQPSLSRSMRRLEAELGCGC